MAHASHFRVSLFDRVRDLHNCHGEPLMDDSQTFAISEYLIKTGRVYEPGDYTHIPIDALMFSDYQVPWKDLDEYKEKRCNYDPETNEWLVHYVTEDLMKVEVPAIYVDITETGVNIVDGAHRVTAYLIAGQEDVLARLNGVSNG